MKSEKEHFLNVKIDKDDNEKEELQISIKAIFVYLKKYFSIWLTLAVVVASFVFSVSSIMRVKEESELEAVVSFVYDGIENGRNPNGGDFDVYEIISPIVIKQTLEEYDMPLNLLDRIQNNISIQSVVPQDIYDKTTKYEKIISQGTTQSLAAVKEVTQLDYFPTKYKVFLNYSKAGMNQKDGVKVFNGILRNYRQYFFEKYGYNYALGDSLKDFNKYENDYDFAELLDIYSTAIDSLQTYLNGIQVNDTAVFRSDKTGYTFADLSKRLDNIKSIDLDVLASFISVNNITKNKPRLISYYQYRIENLEREKKVWDEQLKTITELISTYERGEMVLFGSGTSGDGTDSSVSIPQQSETYDSLFTKKLSAQQNASNIVQKIDFYKTRVALLQNADPNNSKELCDEVQANLNKLYVKIDEVTELTNATAEEYYDTVTLGDAYKILVPASSSVKGTVSIVVSKAIMPIVVSEAALFGIYVLVAFIVSLVKCNEKKETESEDAEYDDCDEEDTDSDESDETDIKTEENKSVKTKTNKRK